MTRSRRPYELTGMTGFTVVWLGQLVSMLGSGMTGFAITIWAWQETGQATVLALVGLATFGPSVLVAPFAGALVDRFDRKLVMVLSDLGSSFPALVMLVLHWAGALEVWHLYGLGACAGAFGAFHFPAYSAAISTMLPKKEYARASGMLSLAGSGSGVAAPILAGILLVAIGLRGILVIDLVTFAFAVATLLVVAIPKPAPAAVATARRSLWRDSLFGFAYILQRRALLHLQLVFTVVNFTATFGVIVLAPMILARTGNDQIALGAVQSAMGVGGVAGGLFLSIWGGPKRRVRAVLLGMLGWSLLGLALTGIGRDLPVWLVAAFCMSFFIPLLNAANQSIWQSKVEPALQGRVFAARATIARVTTPLAMLLAGPLADRVLEPALMPGGALVPLVGRLVGTGAGAGMALMLVLAGTATALTALVAMTLRSVRDVESSVPDHDAAVAATVVTS
jgi:MFS transporter, DHA3 family, macrolide efflux protein